MSNSESSSLHKRRYDSYFQNLGDINKDKRIQKEQNELIQVFDFISDKLLKFNFACFILSIFLCFVKLLSGEEVTQKNLYGIYFFLSSFIYFVILCKIFLFFKTKNVYLILTYFIYFYPWIILLFFKKSLDLSLNHKSLEFIRYLQFAQNLSNLLYIILCINKYIYFSTYLFVVLVHIYISKNTYDTEYDFTNDISISFISHSLFYYVETYIHKKLLWYISNNESKKNVLNFYSRVIGEAKNFYFCILHKGKIIFANNSLEELVFKMHKENFEYQNAEDTFKEQKIKENVEKFLTEIISCRNGKNFMENLNLILVSRYQQKLKCKIPNLKIKIKNDKNSEEVVLDDKSDKTQIDSLHTPQQLSGITFRLLDSALDYI